MQVDVLSQDAYLAATINTIPELPSMLSVGDKAPDFQLPDSDMNAVSLDAFLGSRNLVLYFYPKDDTSGCTKEACNFRDEFPKFKKIKAEIIGISADSVKSHKKFAEKYNLPFNLLSDESKEVVEKYGVWKEKSMYHSITIFNHQKNAGILCAPILSPWMRERVLFILLLLSERMTMR